MGGLVIVIALLMTVLAVPQGGRAMEKTVDTSISETFTVANNSFDAFRFPAGSSDTISVTVQVTTGGNIDVFYTIEKEYNIYKVSPSFSYYPTLSSKNTKLHAFSMQPSQTEDGAGTYVLIVDNQNLTSSGAMPIGSVTYKITASKSAPSAFDYTFAILIVCGPGIVIFVIALYFYMKRKKQREAMAGQFAVATPSTICPTCGTPTRYIAQYGRFYCDMHKGYVPTAQPAAPPPQTGMPPPPPGY